METVVLSWADFVAVPFYLIVLLSAAIFFRDWHYKDNPIKEFFLPGLLLKVAGGLAVGLVYEFYYSGAGDTFSYFKTLQGMHEVLWTDPADAIRLLFIDFDNKVDFASTYDLKQKYAVDIPFWGFTDAYNVCRILFLFMPLTFNSYYALSIFVSTTSFIGIWGLFRVFVSYYPMLVRKIGIAMFYLPSVFFWGSGVLKDSITLGALGIITYLCHKTFIKHKLNPFYFVIIFLCGYALYVIKPYIIMAFLPFAAFWIGLENQHKIPNALIRSLIGPIMVIGSVVGGYVALIQLSEGSSRFSVENVASFAAAHRNDLLRNKDYYKDSEGSAFDIGEFEPTPIGVLSKFPIATFTTFYRPLIFETTSPVIFLSALENAYLLYLSIMIFWSTGIWGFFRHIMRNPLLIFSFFYSVSFAFSVGLATSNFGALVRYKIPCIPFFFATLFIVNYLENKRKAEISERNNLYIESVRKLYSTPKRL